MYHLLRVVPFFVCVLLAALVVPGAGGQEKKLKELQWSHAFDLACRKNDEKTIDKKTKRWGVEAFRDNNTGVGIGLFISEVGCISLAPNFAGLTLPLDPSKGPDWITGLDMPTRKAGVNAWKGAKIHSMEIFRDPNTDNWLYVTDIGNIAAGNAKRAGAGGSNPKWIHSVDLQVRKGGVKELKDASKFGIEVYRDGNTGNLVYITENGFVAIAYEEKEAIVDKDKGGKSPEWLHGLDLSCRKHDEKSFTKDTRKFGVEVYNDTATGNLIFISENGSIAVAPAVGKIEAPTAKAKEPTWTHGLNVKCRKYGEKEFSETTRAFGAEVFRDENVNVTIYINELGNIAALTAK